MQSVKEIIEQAEATIEGFLVTHPISLCAIHDRLVERMKDPIFPNQWFAADFATSMWLPEETHQFFKPLVEKYGKAVLDRAVDLYVSKHRSAILRDYVTYHKEATGPTSVKDESK